MTPRRWAIFIVVNIVVSALTTLLVLNMWDASRSVPRAAMPTTVPTLNPTRQTQVAATVKAPTKTPTPANVQKYTVEFGDTLSEIARKFDVSVDDIKALNNLPNPDILSEGQVLLVPGSPLTPTPTRVPIPTSTRAPLPVITGTASTAL
ncbi:MAG: LysM peptidoglycan-binding domain-containing protein, partial [Chloroflexi bacterium]|nr:LysM peptidoglycan-binding domain-containing protein [Chloroflexota bacterium]